MDAVPQCAFLTARPVQVQLASFCQIAICPARTVKPNDETNRRRTFARPQISCRAQTIPVVKNTSVSGCQAGLKTVPETQPAVCLPTVSGTIPAWLSGKLSRVGPSVFEVVTQDGEEISFTHWADCISYIHRFTIDGRKGQVLYESRNIAKHVERAASAVPAKEYDPMTIGSITQRPWHCRLRKMLQRPTRDSDTPNAECFPVGVAIERNTMGSNYVVTTDAPVTLEVHPETLEPKRFIPYSDLGAKGGQMACAHGEYCPNERAYYNLLLSAVTSRGAIRIVRVCAETGVAKVFARIENCPSTYIHSFGMTDKYIVVVVGSVRIRGLSLLFHRAFTKGIHYDKNANTRIHLVCRKTGRHVSTHEADPSFCFHTVNAFDSGPNEVSIDTCRYENVDALHGLFLDEIGKPRHHDISVLTRYVLPNIDTASPWRPWNTQRAIETRHADLPPIDMPVVHPRVKGRSHRYIYGVTSTADRQFFAGLVKIDCELGTSLVYRHEGKYVSEPIFVPRPALDSGSSWRLNWGKRGVRAEQDEDDGVVLFVELDGRHAEAESALVILDAKTMTEVARCVSPVTIPFTFHGEFTPDDSMQEQESL